MSAGLAPPPDERLGSAAFLADPYPAYAEWREQAPVWFSERLGGFVVSRFADVRGVLGDAQGFRQSQAWERGLTDALGARPLVALDPPEHAAIRRAFSPPFRPRALEAEMTAVVERAVAAALDPLAAGEPFELNAVSMRLSMAVVAALIGSEDSPELARRYATVLDALRQVRVNQAGDDVVAAGQAAGRELIGYLRDLRSQGTRTGGLDLVRTVQESSELDVDAIVTTCANLLIAGVETTVGGVATAVYGLLTHPERCAEVRADPRLAGRAFDEGLRWISPVQMVGKQVAEPRTVAGQELEPGAELILLLGSANRDAERYEDAGTYRFDRRHRDHLAFGSGIHLCLGAPLARLEGRLLIAGLLERFGGLRLDPAREVEFAGGPSARAARVLWLVADR